MSKGPSTKIARVVLEGPRTGDKSVPAVYVRKWWWFWTTAWWGPAWIRHSYIANREAKAKQKAMDLYQQLIKAYEDALLAEKDVVTFIEKAREGSTRGVTAAGTMKLGDTEDYMIFDKDVWKQLVPLIEFLKSNGAKSLRSKRSGETTAYYLPGQLPAWKLEAKGKRPIQAGVDNHIEYRPPDENKGKGKGNQQQNQNHKDRDVQVVMVQPSNKEDG